MLGHNNACWPLATNLKTILVRAAKIHLKFAVDSLSILEISV